MLRTLILVSAFCAVTISVPVAHEAEPVSGKMMLGGMLNFFGLSPEEMNEIELDHEKPKAKPAIGKEDLEPEKPETKTDGKEEAKEDDTDAPKELSCDTINTAKKGHPMHRLLKAVAEHIPNGPVSDVKCLAATQHVTDVPIISITVGAKKAMPDARISGHFFIKAACQAERLREKAGKPVFMAFEKISPETGKPMGGEDEVDEIKTKNRYEITCKLEEESFAGDDAQFTLLQTNAAARAQSAPRPALRPTGLKRLSSEQMSKIPTWQPTTELLQATPDSHNEPEFMKSQGVNCNAAKIQDQGGCGSCWAFAATRTYSDRLCRASKGKWNIPIAEQDMLSCYTSGPFYMAGGERVVAPAGTWEAQDGCDGGNPLTAWIKMMKTGIAARFADPYTAKGGEIDKCGSHSANTVEFLIQDGQAFKIKAGDVEAIKAAIFSEGTVALSMDVFADFSSYSGGIYTKSSDQNVGAHAVAGVGYGSENGVAYWIIANSWGADWGEKGYGRIRRGTNEVGIEAEASFPKVLLPDVCSSSAGCANNGELKKDCSCHCAGLWSGNDCKTCSASCQNGGTKTDECTCSCPTGYTGDNCQDYVLAQWEKLDGYIATIKFSWKLSNYNDGSQFVRFANTLGSPNNPQIGGTAVPISKAEGSVTANVHIMGYVPGFPPAFFYALQLSLGTNEFGASRGSTIVKIPALWYMKDESPACFKGGIKPASSVTGMKWCDGAY